MEDSNDEEEDVEWTEAVSRCKHIDKFNRQNAVNKEENYAKLDAKTMNGMVNHAVHDPRPIVDVSLVGYEAQRRLRKLSLGKITIDFGAGKSVCPINMVLEEPLQDCEEWHAVSGSRWSGSDQQG